MRSIAHPILTPAARVRARRIPTRRTSALVALALALASGCTSITKAPAPAADRPSGCCCSLGTCRPDLTESDCAAEAEFQGWTYKWHPGACTAADTPLPR